MHCRTAAMRFIAAGLSLVIASAALAAIEPPASRPWLDKQRGPDQRAAQALAEMTQAEKLALLKTIMPAMFPAKKRLALPIGAGHMTGVPRLGIPDIAESDASLGIANLGNTRRDDVATALPSSLALGASFDPALAYAGGAMIGSEARAKGFGILLAGGVNLIRDPRAGRNFEYISEDPLLSGILGGQAIAGVQSNAIISTVKHFAANNQETGRNVYSVDNSEAELRESELLAFEIAIKTGKPGSVMCAYNRVGGIYACENAFLLNDVLRRDWQFPGFVMADWGSVHSVGALDNGLDQQSAWHLDRKQFFGTELEKALASGEASQASVDRAVLRILRTLFAHGVVDTPVIPGGTIDYARNSEVALAQAEAGMVLLRNEDGLLPLAAPRRIAVIGGHADAGVLNGGGSSQVTPVGGYKLELKQDGGGLLAFIKRSYGGTSPLDGLRHTFPTARVDYNDGTEIAAAAALAAEADVAIVIGEKWFYETTDSPDLGLGNGQDALVEAVAAANPRTIVVLQTGNPVSLPWRNKVPAILVAWYPGQRGGDAIARVIAGRVNPSGRLPLTWPADLGQLPHPQLPGADVPAPEKGDRASYGLQPDKIPFAFAYREGSDAGHRWFARQGIAPLYPFGHGLSYTNFITGKPRITGDTVRVTVRNTGARAGATVAQIYLVSAAGKPIRRLVGFQKTSLEPRERRGLVITIDPRTVGHWDKDHWTIAAGEYGFAMGENAEELGPAVMVRLPARRIAP